jgi:hypothetical protein
VFRRARRQTINMPPPRVRHNPVTHFCCSSPDSCLLHRGAIDSQIGALVQSRKLFAGCFANHTPLAESASFKELARFSALLERTK